MNVLGDCAQVAIFNTAVASDCRERLWDPWAIAAIGPLVHCCIGAAGWVNSRLNLQPLSSHDLKRCVEFR